MKFFITPQIDQPPPPTTRLTSHLPPSTPNSKLNKQILINKYNCFSVFVFQFLFKKKKMSDIKIIHDQINNSPTK